MGILASPDRSSRAAKEVFKSLFQLVMIKHKTFVQKQRQVEYWTHDMQALNEFTWIWAGDRPGKLHEQRERGPSLKETFIIFVLHFYIQV